MKKHIAVSLFFLLFAPLAANASLDANLYYGLQKNSNVTQLQEFLISKGFLTASATGNFFSLTLKAVKSYQVSKVISPTGYVGVLTRKAINGELAANLPSPSQQQATNQPGATALTPSEFAATSDTAIYPSFSYKGATGQAGATLPPPAPSAAINDISDSLRAQIKALQDQLSLMQQNTPQGPEKFIISFTLSGFNPEISGAIINNNHTVTAVVPDGTDLTKLIPAISVSDNATVFPRSGMVQNFTNPVTYTVTDIYGGTQNYTISVVTESNSG